MKIYSAILDKSKYVNTIATTCYLVSCTLTLHSYISERHTVDFHLAESDRLFICNSVLRNSDYESVYRISEWKPKYLVQNRL